MSPIERGVSTWHATGKSRRPRRLTGVVLLGACGLLVASCYEEIGGLGGAVEHMSINRHGLIAGTSRTGPSGSPRHAFLYDPTTKRTTDLGTAGGDEAVVNDISDDGVVVGYAIGPSFYGVTWNATTLAWTPLAASPFEYALGTHAGSGGWLAGFGKPYGPVDPNGRDTEAVAWNSEGTLFRIGLLPGAVRSGATGVNGHGQVIGHTLIGDCCSRGFVWDERLGVRLLPSVEPTRFSTSTFAINDAGDIVGILGAATNQPAWWRADTLELRTPPGPSGGLPADVNNLRVVLGYSTLTDETYCASLVTGQVKILGRRADYAAEKINDAGAVIGTRNGRWVMWPPGTCSL